MCNRAFWERQVLALRDRHTVITVDLRGHGESSRPRTGYSIGALAADLEQLVRALGLSRVAVVGWSMGGLIALELARRLGPRASALGLVGTTAGGLSDPSRPHSRAGEADAIRAAMRADLRAFARDFAAQCFKAGAEAPLYPWVASQLQRTAPHVAEACFEALMAADLRPHLSALAVPTTVLHGRHDTRLTFDEGEYLAAHIPGARLVAFEESAHAPHLEEPDAFNAALAVMLGDEVAAAAPAPPPVAKAPAPKPAPAAPRAEDASRTAAGKAATGKAAPAEAPAGKAAAAKTGAGKGAPGKTRTAAGAKGGGKHAGAKPSGSRKRQ
jgi:pimeloyl-ACP methyl ester carboxylesterase